MLCTSSLKGHVKILPTDSTCLKQGIIFTPPWATTDRQTRTYISESLPTTPNSTINYIDTTLYPAKLIPASSSTNTSQLGYSTELRRAQFILAEAGIYCINDYLARATAAAANRTKQPSTNPGIYNYLFSVGPALHSDDLTYVFYNSPEQGGDGTAIAELAAPFQQAVLNFVRKGRPGTVGLNGLTWRGYGTDGWTLNWDDGFAGTKAPGDNERCRWLQKGLYQS